MTDRKKDQAWVESQRKKYRDASTGAYVTREYAEANPETTVGETERIPADQRIVIEAGGHLAGIHEANTAPAPHNPRLLLARIEELESQVVALTAMVRAGK